jgi:hypothetical protein
MSDKERISVLYGKMYEGMINKDRLILNTVLSDSFVLEHITGMKQSKQEFIHCIEIGILNYYSEKTENIEVSIYENSAVIIGQSKVTASVFGGRKHIWNLQLAIEALNENGKWMFIRVKASVY